MTTLPTVLVKVAVRLSPRSCRNDRSEQWAADLRDAPSLGISPFSVAVGALSATVVSRGPQPATESPRPDSKGTTMHPLVSPIAKLGFSALGVSALLAGGVALGAGWVSNTLEHGVRVASAGPHAGDTTWATLEDDPPAEVIDVSTLIIAGRMDPTKGEPTP